jgi:hypothetical protein
MNSWKTLKGMGLWAVINLPFMWAVVFTCIFGSVVAYNFVVWIVCIWGFIMIFGSIGIARMKEIDNTKFRELQNTYNSEWHINKWFDIAFDLVVIGLLVYAGFFVISTIYLTTVIAQQYLRKTFSDAPPSYFNDNDDDFDESILDRIGIP